MLERRMVKVETVVVEMEKGNLPSAVTETVNAANKSVVKHLSEQERRKFNLMIFRVQESNSEEANDRIKHDTDKFNEIMDTNLGLGTNTSIHAITRIGKRIRGKDETRPMRVTMKTVQDRKRVLDMIKEMRLNK